MDVLYLSPSASPTASALAAAAERAGVRPVVLRSSADVVAGDAHLYGGPLFCAWAGPLVGASPTEPTDDWLARLPRRFTRRSIVLTTLGRARLEPGRRFLKAPRDKDFEPGVYEHEELPRDDDDRVLLASDVVRFTREHRLLVLDGQVRTGSRYLTQGLPDVRPLAGDPVADDVLAFAEALLADEAGSLPSAVTLDVGRLVHPETRDEGWAVVEANMAWFSNVYACDPDEALRVVMRAAGPTSRLTARDAAFVRTPMLSAQP